MKIGDEVYIHGYIDEIRKDVVIIQNAGGYFGTVESEIAELPEIIRCKECRWWEKATDSIQGWCDLMKMYPTGGWFCGNAQRKVSK